MLSRFKRYLRPLYFWSQSKLADFRHTSSDIEVDSSNEPNHILLICIDALRQDTVPDLPGIKFAEAIAPSTWTFPSVTSTLTGKYPHEHGAIAHTMPGDESFAIPEQVSSKQTLPELFETAGYDTLGLFGFPMPFMATKTWFQSHRVWADERAETVIDRYRDWRNGRNRTFTYLQLADLHAPLDPPQRYIENRDVDTSLQDLPVIRKYTSSYDGSDKCAYYREQRLKLYQAALDYVEDCLKELLDRLNGETTVVLFGDHGEAHWEHYDVDRQFTDSRPNYGVGHGGTPLDMVARVPVGTNDEGLLPEGGWASLIDVPATLSEAVLDSSTGNGEDWLTSIPENRVVFCEGVRYGPERKAVYKNDRKLIHSVSDDVMLSARLLETGEEFGRIDATNLRSQLPNDWAERTGEEAGKVVEEQLEALGYT